MPAAASEPAASGLVGRKRLRMRARVTAVDSLNRTLPFMGHMLDGGPLVASAAGDGSAVA